MTDRRSMISASVLGAIGGATDLLRDGKSPLAAGTTSFARDASLNVHDYGALGDGKTDDTLAIQRAIDRLRDEGLARKDTSHVRRIVFPSGRYMLSDTLSTFPWIKLCSIGSVLLDFSRLPLSRDGIVCRNETMLKPGDLCFPGNRSPFLDGSGGTISVLGPDEQGAQGWGIVLGNRDARFSGEVRDAGGRNVVVTGWRGALRIDAVNTYLSTWVSCRFEGNRENAVFAAPLAGSSVNSGERMTFYDCTFAQTRTALDVRTDSMDFVFDACSFDFMEEVVRLGAGSGYGTVALSHCHIEGIDASIVNASGGGDRLRVAIDHSTVLARTWHPNGQPNAPRKLFAGRFKLSVVAVEFRFEAAAQDASTTLIGDEVIVETLTGLSFSGFDCWPCRGMSLNADALFTSSAPGTPGDKLAHWQVSAAVKGGSAVAQIVAQAAKVDPASRGLRIDASEINTVTVSTKSRFTVRPGQWLAAAAAVEQDGRAGVVRINIDFYAEDGVFVSRASSEAANVARPRSRLRIANLRVAAPPGAALGRLSTDLLNWRGSATFTSIAAWAAS
jgi:hypothetical protein